MSSDWLVQALTSSTKHIIEYVKYWRKTTRVAWDVTNHWSHSFACNNLTVDLAKNLTFDMYHIEHRVSFISNIKAPFQPRNFLRIVYKFVILQYLCTATFFFFFFFAKGLTREGSAHFYNKYCYINNESWRVNLFDLKSRNGDISALIYSLNK